MRFLLDTERMSTTLTAEKGSAARAIAKDNSLAFDRHRDFDWDLGTWTMDMSRLSHPLTGSTTWTHMDGVTINSSVWNGRANLAEVEDDGPGGRLELLALRLYDPVSHQWNVNFATSNVGVLSVPCIGDFRKGRGEFYDQESLDGKSILVRFQIRPLSKDSAQSEQAFSDDGGKTWETNSRGLRALPRSLCRREQEPLASTRSRQDEGRRDRALLSLLLACGLRRHEAVALRLRNLEQREGRWAIVDLVGKGDHIRTVPIPESVREQLECWIVAAEIGEDRLFRRVDKFGNLHGDQISIKAFWHMVKKSARGAGLPNVVPYDLRRTGARLCQLAGGELEQIQFLLGHVSIQTTERYLGSRQRWGRRSRW
jgi:integrase